MKSRYAFALSCVLSGTLGGCCCPHVHDSEPTARLGPTGAVPTVAAPPTPCVQRQGPGVTGQQSVVTEGVYCVCNAVGHNTHGDGKYQGQHFAPNEAVVISTIDAVTEVQFGADKVQMIPSADNKMLSGLVSFPHTRTTAGGGNENVTHLVRITPVTINATQTPGCSTDPSRNSLKITFCSKNADNGTWECGAAAGDYGDTHVQN